MTFPDVCGLFQEENAPWDKKWFRGGLRNTSTKRFCGSYIDTTALQWCVDDLNRSGLFWQQKGKKHNVVQVVTESCLIKVDRQKERQLYSLYHLILHIVSITFSLTVTIIFDRTFSSCSTSPLLERRDHVLYIITYHDSLFSICLHLMLHTFCGPSCNYWRWKGWKHSQQCQLSIAFSENRSNILENSTSNLNTTHLIFCQGHFSPIFSSEGTTTKAETKSSYINLEQKKPKTLHPSNLAKLTKLSHSKFGTLL